MAAFKLKYTNKNTDRYGKVRWYFRRKGQTKKRLAGEPGTSLFMRSYAAALDESNAATIRPKLIEPIRKVGQNKDSLEWLILSYYKSAAYRSCTKGTQRVRALILNRIIEMTGRSPYKGVTPSHIRLMRDNRMDTPASANALVKAVRQVYAFALEYELVTSNPAAAVSYLDLKSNGLHAWTAAEIAKFETKHPIGSRARLAFALMLYTAQRRSDAIRLGSSNVDGEYLTLTQFKNRARKPVTLTLPILPELRTVLDGSDLGSPTFLVTEAGKSFTDAGFGNWFRDRCDEAGLPQCSAHGLRKAALTILANLGATGHELMAVGGHSTLRQVDHYTRTASQKTLADTAMARHRSDTGSKASG